MLMCKLSGASISYLSLLSTIQMIRTKPPQGECIDKTQVLPRDTISQWDNLEGICNDFI